MSDRVETVHLGLTILLVLVLTCLAGAMIGVIFFAPHFGKQFAMPIQPVTCEILTSSEQSTIMTVNPPNIDKCYKVEDVLALNKALRMTDTLSFFGLLLAVFAFIAPVLSYITLKEKQSLENTFNKTMADSTAELKKSVTMSINQFPKIFSVIEVFKTRYQIDQPRGADRCSTEAYEIVFHLLLLLDSSTATNQAFDDIDNYLTDNAVLHNAPHIRALKQALRQIYESSYLGSDERKADLVNFLRGTLKTSLEDFLNDTAPANIN